MNRSNPGSALILDEDDQDLRSPDIRVKDDADVALNSAIASKLVVEPVVEEPIISQAFRESIEIPGYDSVKNTLKGRSIDEMSDADKKKALAFIKDTDVQTNAFFHPFAAYRDDMYYTTWINLKTGEELPSDLQDKTEDEKIEGLKELAQKRADALVLDANAQQAKIDGIANEIRTLEAQALIVADAAKIEREVAQLNNKKTAAEAKKLQLDADVLKAQEQQNITIEDIERVEKQEALWRTIFKNAFMRPERASSTGWFVAWAILSPIIVPLRLAYIALSLVATPMRNVLKGVLELLPDFLNKELDKAKAYVNDQRKPLENEWDNRKENQRPMTLNRLQQLGWTSLLVLISAFRIVTGGWHFFGRQMMSPGKAADIAAKNKIIFGDEIASWWGSLALSTVLWIITAPLLKATIAVPLKSFFQTTVPATWAKFVEAVRNVPWMNDAINAIDHYFSVTLPNFWLEYTPAWVFTAANAVGTFFTQTLPTFFATYTPAIVVQAGQVVGHAIANAFVTAYNAVMYAANVVANAILLPLNYAMAIKGSTILLDTNVGAAAGAATVVGTVGAAVYDSAANAIRTRYGRNAQLADAPKKEVLAVLDGNESEIDRKLAVQEARIFNAVNQANDIIDGRIKEVSAKSDQKVATQGEILAALQEKQAGLTDKIADVNVKLSAQANHVINLMDDVKVLTDTAATREAVAVLADDTKAKLALMVTKPELKVVDENARQAYGQLSQGLNAQNARLFGGVPMPFNQAGVPVEFTQVPVELSNSAPAGLPRHS